MSHQEICQMQLDEAIARHVEQSEKAVAKIPMHLRTIISKSEIGTTYIKDFNGNLIRVPDIKK